MILTASRIRQACFNWKAERCLPEVQPGRLKPVNAAYKLSQPPVMDGQKDLAPEEHAELQAAEPQ